MENTEKKKPGPKKGITRTEEHKQAISRANKGRKLSEETRRRMSEAKKGRMSNIWLVQDCHKEESKRKMSEAHKGKVLSQETKTAMSEAHKGLPCYWRQGKTWMTFDGNRVWFWFKDMAEIFEKYKDCSVEGSKRNMSYWSQLMNQDKYK